MNIIKEGKLPEHKIYRTDCNNCGTIFEFEQFEARFISDFRDGNCLMAHCPLCKKEVYVSFP